MTREELKSADTISLISALEYCGRDSYYATYYDEVVDEITKRLDRIAELEKENAELKEQIEKMKCCENCGKKGHICVAEEMQGKLCGKNKDKWELRR